YASGDFRHTRSALGATSLHIAIAVGSRRRIWAGGVSSGGDSFPREATGAARRLAFPNPSSGERDVHTRPLFHDIAGWSAWGFFGCECEQTSRRLGAGFGCARCSRVCGHVHGTDCSTLLLVARQPLCSVFGEQPQAEEVGHNNGNYTGHLRQARTTNRRVLEQ